MPNNATNLIMFLQLISFVPRFKSTNFYQNGPKIKLSLQKNKQTKVSRAELHSQTVNMASGGPKQPPIADFWLRARIVQYIIEKMHLF